MNKAVYQTCDKCRICQSELIPVLDLGEQFIVDFVAKPEGEFPKAPLKLVRCGTCGLVQLSVSVDKDLLYKKFWYRSGINEQMRKALESVVDKTTSVAFVGAGDSVLDIGSNDGTLLGWYPGEVTTVGCDPCEDLMKEAVRQNKIDIPVNDYFSLEAVQPHGPYKVITAIAMFYDVDDPVKFLSDCKAVLKQDGVIVIQMNYLPAMISNCAVDNIEHEHLTYFSMHTLKTCADKAGLECVGAETNDVNGGSFRVYLTHKDSGLYGISNDQQAKLFVDMMRLMHEEQKMGLDKQNIYTEFGKAIMARCGALQSYLTKTAEAGGKIYIYGASTRGTVLMQLLNLSDGVILGCAERDNKKFGLHMMGGTWPKIYPEAYVREKATHMLVLPWHFLDSIWTREVTWLKNGGKMIVPLPDPRELTIDGASKSLLKWSISREARAEVTA